MRRILSVTGALCLLIAGAAWAPAAEDTATKKMDGKVAGAFSFILKPDHTATTRQMLKGLTGQGASSAASTLSVFFHADDAQTFQTFLQSDATVPLIVGSSNPPRSIVHL